MNVLEYIEYLMEERGMSEEDANREADAVFSKDPGDYGEV